MALTGTVIFCVDSDILFAARTVLFVDLDFFLSVAGTVFPAGKSSGEGRVALFVTFPSDARSSWRWVGLSFYSDASSLGDSVAPVRRREDTEGDRDFGVKVQGDDREGVLSRMPSEPLSLTIRKEDKKRLLLRWERVFDVGREVKAEG